MSTIYINDQSTRNINRTTTRPWSRHNRGFLKASRWCLRVRISCPTATRRCLWASSGCLRAQSEPVDNRSNKFDTAQTSRQQSKQVDKNHNKLTTSPTSWQQPKQSRSTLPELGMTFTNKKCFKHLWKAYAHWEYIHGWNVLNACERQFLNGSTFTS